MMRGPKSDLGGAGRTVGNGFVRRWAAGTLLIGFGAISFAFWLSRSNTGQLWWADRALDQGRLDQAEAILAIQARTEDPRAITRLARLRLLQRRPDSVVRLLGARLKGWTDPESLSLLGEANLALGRTQEAWGIYRRFLEQRPDDITALTRYAELTYRHSGLAEALIPYRRLEHLQPGRVEWPRALGQIYMEIDRYELAVAAFRDAARIDPDSGDLRFALAEAEFLAGHLDACLADLDLAGATLPNDTRIPAARAECLVALGRNNEAVQFLETVLSREPGHLRAMRLRAELHLQRRDFAHALELLERARRVDPDDWRVLYKLALVYDRLGRRDEARAAQLRMQELQKDSAQRF
jgi:tetratricopeptide (TPR) repeat protein